MEDETRQYILEVIHGYAKESLRTICLAYKDLHPEEGGHNHMEDDPD